MENKSIGKNSINNGIEVYLVTTISDCGETRENFVTLDEKFAIETAFDMYEAYDRENVFVETWKNNVITRLGYIIKGFSNMENKSIEKNLIDDDVEVYLVMAVSPNGETLENFITLDRKLSVEKAFDMDGVYNPQTVFVETWRDGVMIGLGYILDGKLIEERFN